MTIVVAFLLLSGVSSAGVLAMPRSASSRFSAVGGMAQAATLGVAAVWFLTGHVARLEFWPLTGWGMLGLAGTPLAGLFLLIVAVIFLAVFLYTPGYLRHYRDQYDLRPLLATTHALLATIALILLAGDVITFLVAWEMMSILSYLTVTFDQADEQSARAAYVMLGASEVGFLMMLAAWLPLTAASHSISFAVIARTAAPLLSGGMRWAIFLLSFVGFGVKAGLFPGMSWLPRAHPAAPANASAILSGVILNLGVYGIVLTNAILLPIPGVLAGLVVLGVGSVTALIGILYAATDTHIKRLLAHSSIENMGLAMTAMGAALTFDALHLPILGLLAWIAALYHVVNHSVYKTLLFLGAGAIDQVTGELDMDRLGGLARRMRWTSLFMLAGTLAIAALPPFNGFVSEWLILQSLLRSVSIHQPAIEIVFALSGVLIALTAGLAATAFIRFFGMTFLGYHRSAKAEGGREVSAAERLAMGFLAALALALGVTPTYVATGLSRVVGTFADGKALADFVPRFFSPAALPTGLGSTFYPLGAGLGRGVLPGPGLVFLHQSAHPPGSVVFAMSPSYLAIAMVVGLGLIFVLVRVLTPRHRTVRGRAWLGGIRRVDPGMTYTATGLSRPIWVVFRTVLSPRDPVDREEVVAKHFRVSISRQDVAPYVVDRLLLAPSAALALALAHLLAKMHHGSINAYIGYALVTVLAALVLVRLT